MISKEQAEFLDKLIPLAHLVQNYVFNKVPFTNLEYSPGGLYPSVTVAEILIQSNWGDHPVSKDDMLYNTAKGVSKRYSNNLTLLEVSEGWKGKSNPYEGKVYRAYKDWQTFAADFSDYIVFSGKFDSVLIEPNPYTQLDLFALTKESPGEYYDSMITIINKAQFYLDGRK